jgi:hypothetical protein
MSASTACQLSPPSDVQRAGTATEPISVRPEPSATPENRTALIEIPDSGVKSSTATSVVWVALTMPMPVIAMITFLPPRVPR